jgi:hypothetical protein
MGRRFALNAKINEFSLTNDRCLEEMSRRREPKRLYSTILARAILSARLLIS